MKKKAPKKSVPKIALKKEVSFDDLVSLALDTPANFDKIPVKKAKKKGH